MTEAHLDADQLLALALAEQPAAEQELLSAHLAVCATCRDEYAALSDGVQAALVATPSVAPPAGFSGRVLAAMAADEPAPTPAARRPRRTVLLIAAAVLVGLLSGIGGTLAASTWLTQPAGGRHQVPVAASLVTRKGETVGSVGLTTLNGRSYLLLNVTTGRPGASYECVLVGRDGQRTSGGSWALSDEYGTGEASGSWLVPLAGEQPASVELVAPSGVVWSQARF
ncbi:MAG: hypothetical protein LCH96_06485 [Actinobacteria bacterium]|nr:hypothetical protein [Actinomycetota bacterium]